MAQSTVNSNKEESNANGTSKSVKNNEKREEKKEDLQKSSSSYYLYKSTNPEEAKKYAPKKLDNQSAQSIENSVKSSSKGSSWNTGATMEQFDYSEWMKQRLEILLKTVTFKNSQIRIVEVTKIDGSATILLTRGKYRPGYDISFECKWKGFVDPNYTENENENDDDEKDKKKEKKANGILKMDEITSEDDPDDWEYEVSIKKLRVCLYPCTDYEKSEIAVVCLCVFRKSKVNKLGLSLVKKDRESVIKVINEFIAEFKKKK